MSSELERITNYLTNGGLFNPELMPQGAGRDLLIDCRARIKAAEAERDRLAADLQTAKVEAGEAMLIVETQDQQIKSLAADNARLREALAKISSPTQTTDLLWWQHIARAALASVKGD